MLECRPAGERAFQEVHQKGDKLWEIKEFLSTGKGLTIVLKYQSPAGEPGAKRGRRRFQRRNFCPG